MRYTEYHAGVAVIKDKALLSQAMEKLAKIEDMNHIPEICCDEYCKYPQQGRTPEDMDRICDECKLSELFDLLVDKEN
ncbi:MAG: hypothetical protein KHX75_12910 [Lachnospiraceae bacterium]|nr:hypothetical protein [Lachnospiraceae bacterium]MBS5469724.1 hypothetical protein [Clostridium sp.]